MESICENVLFEVYVCSIVYVIKCYALFTRFLLSQL
jgi:hypothetical protein